MRVNVTNASYWGPNKVSRGETACLPPMAVRRGTYIDGAAATYGMLLKRRGRQLRCRLISATSGTWPYGHTDQWVRPQTLGFLVVFHSNHALKMQRFRTGSMGLIEWLWQTDRQTDRQTDGSQHCIMPPSDDCWSNYSGAADGRQSICSSILCSTCTPSLGWSVVSPVYLLLWSKRVSLYPHFLS